MSNMMTTEEEFAMMKVKAEKILEEILGEKRLVNGLQNNNWVFMTNDGKKPYMVKFMPVSEAERLGVEVALNNYIGLNTDIPVPKILKYDKGPEEHFLVREVIPGQSLQEEIEAGADSSPLFYEAGHILAKLHSIEFDKKGILNSDLTVQEYEIYSQKEFDSMLNVLLEKKLLTQIEYHQLQQISVEKYYGDWPNVFCHCDYTPNNILAKGGQIVGLIDMEWASSCPFVDDVATFDLFAHYLGLSKYLESFYAGYNSISPISKRYFENLGFYHFYRLITMLSYQVQAKDERFEDDFFNWMNEQLTEGLARLLSS